MKYGAIKAKTLSARKLIYDTISDHIGMHVLCVPNRKIYEKAITCIALCIILVSNVCINVRLLIY